MVVAEKVQCDCGHMVKNPQHLYHVRSEKHQAWLQVGDVVEGQGDNNSVTTSNAQDEPGVFVSPVKVFKAEPLHENLQAAIDTFDAEKNFGIHVERRAQLAARVVRHHFSLMEWPNEGHPGTVADMLAQLNIPILDPRTGKVPEVAK